MHHNVLSPQYGVASASASDVWAVGSSSDSRTTSTLIEHWDGASWGVVASFNQSSTNILTGLAALSTGNLWAVGNYFNDSGYFQTLTELFSQDWYRL